MSDTEEVESPAEDMGEAGDAGFENSTGTMEMEGTGGEGNTDEEETDEFSDEELDQPEKGQNIKEQKREDSNSSNSPSPVPTEVKEEFNELKDM